MKTIKTTFSNTGFLTLFMFCFILILNSACTAIPPISDLPGGQEIITRGQRFIMKQKIWSFRDEFIIKSEHNVPAYYVRGKAFSIGDRLSFFDRNSKQLAYISEKFLSFPAKYRVFKGNRLYANIKRKFTIFKKKYLIDMPGSDDYRIEGNFLNYEYRFFRRGKVVATVSKKFFSWGDTYGIQIAPGEDKVLILSAAVVIDMVNAKDENDY